MRKTIAAIGAKKNEEALASAGLASSAAPAVPTALSSTPASDDGRGIPKASGSSPAAGVEVKAEETKPETKSKGKKGEE